MRFIKSAIHLLFICFCVQSLGQDIAGTWSGSMTLESTFKGITGTAQKKVSLTITDNHVRGTVEGQETTILGVTDCGTVTCSGAGEGQLWMVAFNADGTYDIEAISPEYSCTGFDRCSGKTAHKTGTMDVSVHSQPIPANRNLLSGIHTNQVELPGLGSGSTTVTWHLSRSGGIGLIIIPDNYEDWLPKPGKDELTSGSVIKITLNLVSANGAPVSIKAKRFELKLSNTSTEPGITINAPHRPLLTDLPDLRFLARAGAGMDVGSQSMDISCDGCTTTTVQLGAFDGGGWTTLTAKAILEDDSEIEGKLLSNAGPTEVLIPKRSHDSHIAISWLNANGNPNEQDDNEKSDGNSNDGDGLTTYEEYRGVITEGEFKRLDPQKKEVGIWMKKNEVTIFDKGIRMFEKASGLKVVRFIDNEVANDRKLNRNFLTAHSYDQYVLKLEKTHLAGGTLGQNEPLTVRDKTPILSTRVAVDVDKIRRYHQYFKTNSISMPYTEEEELATTTAHEIGHGVHISHHGPNSIYRDLLVTGTFRFANFVIRNKYGQTISLRPYKLKGNDGTIHNDASGNYKCLMTYTNFYSWSMNDKGNIVLCVPVPDTPYGTILCTSGDGTDLNANHHFFDNAASGNCLSKIKLK